MRVTVGDLLAQIERYKAHSNRMNGDVLTDESEIVLVPMHDMEYDWKITAIEADVYDMDQGLVLALVAERDYEQS